MAENRSPEAIERRKVAARAKGRERWKTPEYRAKKNAYAAANREKRREYARTSYRKNAKLNNKKRIERARKNREHTNRKAREQYAKNREQRLANIRAARIKRNPARGLERAIFDFRSGKISHDQLVGLIGDRLALANAGNVQELSGTAGRDSNVRTGEGSNLGDVCSRNREHPETET